jgi:hypothetical protein
MIGAACATVIGYLTLAVVDCVFSIGLYPVPYEWRRLAGLAGLLLVLILVVVNIDTGSRIMDVALKTAVVAAYPLLLFVFGFLSPSERAAIRRLFERARSRAGVLDAELPVTGAPEAEPGPLPR